MAALDFCPAVPQIIKPESSCFTYPTPCEEFSLTRIHAANGGFPEAIAAAFQKRPLICVVTEGGLAIEGEIIGKGESIFIPASTETLHMAAQGNCTLYIASPGLP
jgi:mannose-6-phosphate isomerase class I